MLDARRLARGRYTTGHVRKPESFRDFFSATCSDTTLATRATRIHGIHGIDPVFSPIGRFVLLFPLVRVGGTVFAERNSRLINRFRLLDRGFTVVLKLFRTVSRFLSSRLRSEDYNWIAEAVQRCGNSSPSFRTWNFFKILFKSSSFETGFFVLSFHLFQANNNAAAVF